MNYAYELIFMNYAELYSASLKTFHVRFAMSGHRPNQISTSRKEQMFFYENKEEYLMGRKEIKEVQSISLSAHGN